MMSRDEKNQTRWGGGGNWREGTRRGWQLRCYGCQRQSKPVTTNAAPIEPHGIQQRFERQGWTVGVSANHDLCSTCRENLYSDGKRLLEQQRRNKGRIDHLLLTIQQLDKFLNENVTVYSSPEFASEHTNIIQAVGSLIETAYMLDLVPSRWQPDGLKAPEPVARIMTANASAPDEPEAEPLPPKLWLEPEPELMPTFAEITAKPEPMPAPKPTPPMAPPKPMPPKPPVEQSSSTHEYLLKMRMQIYGGGTARPCSAERKH
jgi:hypothetical protein